MATTMAFSDDARQAQDINNRRIEQRMVVLKRDGKNKPFYETGRAAYIAGKPFHPNESDGWCAGWRDAEDAALGRA